MILSILIFMNAAVFASTNSHHAPTQQAYCGRVQNVVSQPHRKSSVLEVQFAGDGATHWDIGDLSITPGNTISAVSVEALNGRSHLNELTAISVRESRAREAQTKNLLLCIVYPNSQRVFEGSKPLPVLAANFIISNEPLGTLAEYARLVDELIKTAIKL